MGGELGRGEMAARVVRWIHADLAAQQGRRRSVRCCSSRRDNLFCRTMNGGFSGSQNFTASQQAIRRSFGSSADHARTDEPKAGETQ